MMTFFLAARAGAANGNTLNDLPPASQTPVSAHPLDRRGVRLRDRARQHGELRNSGASWTTEGLPSRTRSPRGAGGEGVGVPPFAGGRHDQESGLAR